MGGGAGPRIRTSTPSVVRAASNRLTNARATDSVSCYSGPRIMILPTLPKGG